MIMEGLSTMKEKNISMDKDNVMLIMDLVYNAIEEMNIDLSNIGISDIREIVKDCCKNIPPDINNIDVDAIADMLDMGKDKGTDSTPNGYGRQKLHTGTDEDRYLGTHNKVYADGESMLTVVDQVQSTLINEQNAHDSDQGQSPLINESEIHDQSDISLANTDQSKQIASDTHKQANGKKNKAVSGKNRAENQPGYRRKLNHAEKLLICSMYLNNVPLKKIAAYFRVSVSTVHNTLHREPYQSMINDQLVSINNQMIQTYSKNMENITGIMDKFLDKANNPATFERYSLPQLNNIFGTVIDKMNNLQSIEMRREELRRKYENNDQLSDAMSMLQDLAHAALFNDIELDSIDDDTNNDAQ